MISTALIEYNFRGLIPGPDEEEEAFYKRVAYCLKLTETLAAFSPVLAACQRLGEWEGYGAMAAGVQQRYDLSLEWLPILFSNAQLAPWHGACAWIVQLDNQAPTAAFLQLRKNFCYKKKYLGLYGRDEVIAHELIHACRMAFNEPQFEELLACRSSATPWRAFFSAIFQSSKETLFFIIWLLTLLSLDIYSLISAASWAVSVTLWLQLGAIILLFFAGGRLFLRQHTLRRCLVNLAEAIANKEKVEALLIRLTDREISSFAALTPEKIRSYALDAAATSLRWRLLNAVYFYNYFLKK